MCILRRSFSQIPGLHEILSGLLREMRLLKPGAIPYKLQGDDKDILSAGTSIADCFSDTIKQLKKMER